MYAMDHTLHFEHRADERADTPRSRWSRRSGITVASANAPVVATTPADADTSPTHLFLD